jgi:hypothetical protein
MFDGTGLNAANYPTVAEVRHFRSARRYYVSVATSKSSACIRRCLTSTEPWRTYQGNNEVSLVKFDSGLL